MVGFPPDSIAIALCGLFPSSFDAQAGDRGLLCFGECLRTGQATTPRKFRNGHLFLSWHFEPSSLLARRFNIFEGVVRSAG
jgi:hypothetical protein